MEQQLLRESTVRELVMAGAVQRARVVAYGPGFAVMLTYGTAEGALANKQGDIRLFASLDTVVPFLRRFGLRTFEVDASEYEPGRLRKARPDRAAALRRTRTRPLQSSLI